MSATHPYRTLIIGDNIRFLQQSFAQFTPLLRQHEQLLRALKENAATPELVAGCEPALRECDLNFLIEKTPRGHRTIPGRRGPRHPYGIQEPIYIEDTGAIFFARSDRKPVNA